MGMRDMVVVLKRVVEVAVGEKVINSLNDILTNHILVGFVKFYSISIWTKALSAFMEKSVFYFFGSDRNHEVRSLEVV